MGFDRPVLDDDVVVIAVPRQGVAMDQRAVVALEEVFGHDLPVGGDAMGNAPRTPHRSEVDPGDLTRQLHPWFENRGDRRCSRYGRDEQEIADRPDRENRQLALLGVHLDTGRTTQCAVEVVGPTVVDALERLAAPTAFRDDRPAMTADVGQRAQDALHVAGDHDGEVAEEHGRVGTGLPDVFGGSHVVPVRAKDQLALDPEHLGIQVPVGRDRVVGGGHSRSSPGFMMAR
jgi:hypothetical protein